MIESTTLYNSEKPLVSICCSTYNHENYIAEALDGFLIQKCDFPVEILINEDCSTDNTAGIIKEYQKKFPKIIKPVFQKENQFSKGVRPFFQLLLPRTKGKYIAICEGDDYWTDPHKLQKQVDFMDANEEYSICFHEADVVNKSGDFMRKYNKLENDTDFNIYDLTENNFISTASVFFRKRNIANLPVKFHQLHAGDWGLHFWNAQYGKIRYLKDCMSAYRQHDGSIWSSLNQNEMIIKGVEVMKQIDDLFEYKFHKYFEIGIEKRLKKIKHTKEKSLFEKLNKKFRIRTRIKAFLHG